MNKVSNAFRKALNIMYKIIPLAIGIICYYPQYAVNGGSNYPLCDAFFSALKLYSGSIECGLNSSGLLQLARFMALAAALSILIGVFNKLQDIITMINVYMPSSTVVYGDSECAEHLYNDLPRHIRIRGGNRMIKHASRYVIMFSDDDSTLSFYNRNYDILAGKRVYLQLENISRQNIQDPTVSVFSPSENCARSYWKSYPVERSEKIAIIGFGSVGQDILSYGLQINLIDPQQHFEYHVYGDGRQFRREHISLGEMMPDSIVFHDDGITNYEELRDFDRLIICGSESENLLTVSRLMEFVPGCPALDVYAPGGDLMSKLFGNDRLRWFGRAEDTASAEVVLNEKCYEAARRQHEAYASKYGGVSWQELDSFKRYSNVSSSDFEFTIDRLIKKGVPAETIAELEHIRWCRYHYLNNWKYGEQRNDKMRIHNCLVPYSQLSEEEKQKDADAIRSRKKEQ